MKIIFLKTVLHFGEGGAGPLFHPPVNTPLVINSYKLLANNETENVPTVSEIKSFLTYRERKKFCARKKNKI